MVRCDGMLEAEVDGEIVALHIDRGECYGMNAVASRVWELLSEPRSVAELCAVLVDEYDIDAGACESQISDYCKTLRDEGLLVAAD